MSIVVKVGLAILCVGAVSFLAFVVVQTREPPGAAVRKPVDSTPEAVAESPEVRPEWKPPFEYQILKQEERKHFMRPLHVLSCETTVEAAKSATEASLKQLWEDDFLIKFGNESVADIRFTVETPGADPWGFIRRRPLEPLNPQSKYRMEFDIIEDHTDPPPSYFVPKIDRTVEWQRTFMIDLPTANTIIENVRLLGMTIDHRSDNFIVLKAGSAEASVEMWPSSLTVSRQPPLLPSDPDMPFGFREVASEALRPTGLWEQIDKKLKSVIGSPEYLDAEQASSRPFNVHWTIGRYEIRYSHYGSGRDEIDVHIPYSPPPAPL